MVLRLILLAIFILPLSGCWESEPAKLTAPAQTCRCKSDVEDTLEEPLSFQFGAFKGRCVDSCRFRRARTLSVEETKRYGGDHNHVVVGNFRHDKEYWIARIPVADVENVDMLFEDFYHGILHVALRFRLKGEGIRLYPQNPTQKAAPSEPIQDLVLSIEGVAAKDEHYDVWNSALGNYLVDYRLQSARETADHMVRKYGHLVKQYRLILPARVRSEMLRKGLAASERESFASTYQLLFNNCATAALDLIDSVMRTESAGMLGFTHVDRGWPLDLANGTLRALRSIGVLKPGDESRIENLEIDPGSG